MPAAVADGAGDAILAVASVAQLVEQLALNQRVAGSSPAGCIGPIMMEVLPQGGPPLLEGAGAAPGMSTTCTDPPRTIMPS